MIMDKGEICRDYKSAKNKKEQIKILAQLNCTTEAYIKAVLIENGLVVPKVKSEKQETKRTETKKEKLPDSVFEEMFSRMDSIEDELKKCQLQICCLTDEYIAIAEFIKSWKCAR